jgi:F-type H+-transporting ATPase subunit epsilon
MKSKFDATIITPKAIKIVENISFFRAEDKSGSFGILPRHTAFLTVLESAIAIAEIDDKEHYYAFNGGILSFKNNDLKIMTQEFIESDDLNRLLDSIKYAFKVQEEQERLFSDNIENLQNAFIKKLIEMERDVG